MQLNLRMAGESFNPIHSAYKQDDIPRFEITFELKAIKFSAAPVLMILCQRIRLSSHFG